jgi:hypothetical protein
MVDTPGILRFKRLTNGLGIHLITTYPDTDFIRVDEEPGKGRYTRYFYWRDGPSKPEVEQHVANFLAAHGCGERKGDGFSIAGIRQLVFCRRKTTRLRAAHALVLTARQLGRMPHLNHPADRNLYMALLDASELASPVCDVANLVDWFTAEDLEPGFQTWKKLAETISEHGLDVLDHTADVLFGGGGDVTGPPSLERPAAQDR